MKGALLRRSGLAVLVLFALCAPARSQSRMSQLPPRAKTASLAGPRFGFTMLPDGVVGALANKKIKAGPYISQFGWQFEKQFYTKDSGVTMVTEWVALAGGLEQNLMIPSLSWVVGMRTREGAEFGLGPMVTPAGSGLVLAGGVTFRTGAFNIPFNVAFVPSKNGARVSVLSGFSLRN